jgi:hypothetical protein
LIDSLKSVKALLSRKITHRTHINICVATYCGMEVEVEIMWFSSHVGFEGNVLVDKRARHAAQNGVVFDRPFPLVDFKILARSVVLREWQEKWYAADFGRFAYFTTKSTCSTLV